MKTIPMFFLTILSLWLVASRQSPAQDAATAAGAAPTTATSPDALLSKLGSHGALFYDEMNYLASRGEGGGGEGFIVRRNVRLISDSIQILCDTLEYDSVKDLMVAQPAFGKRVELRFGGMRANCGLLEYSPNKEKAILRRNPVIYQRDERNREFETRGYLITITLSQTKQATVLIQSKKGEVSELGPKTPATLMVDTEPPKGVPQAVSLRDLQKQLGALGARPLTAGDLSDIPANIRPEDQLRP